MRQARPAVPLTRSDETRNRRNRYCRCSDSISAGATLPPLEPIQEAVINLGFAIQWLVTTENTIANFQPKTGRTEEQVVLAF